MQDAIGADRQATVSAYVIGKDGDIQIYVPAYKNLLIIMTTLESSGTLRVLRLTGYSSCCLVTLMHAISCHVI